MFDGRFAVSCLCESVYNRLLVNTASQPLVLVKTVLSWHLFPYEPLTLRLFKLEYSNSRHLNRQVPSTAENY